MKHLQRWGNFILEQFKYPELYKEGQTYKGVTEFPKEGDVKYVYIISLAGEAVANVIILDDKGKLDMDYMPNDYFALECVVDERGLKPEVVAKHIPGKSQLKPKPSDVSRTKVFITDLKPINKEQVPNHQEIDKFLAKMKQDAPDRKTGLELNQAPKVGFDFGRKYVNSDDPSKN